MAGLQSEAAVMNKANWVWLTYFGLMLKISRCAVAAAADDDDHDDDEDDIIATFISNTFL